MVAEGLEFHIPKGYIYFAMAFSVFVELINPRVRGQRDQEPVHLRDPYPVVVEDPSDATRVIQATTGPPMT